jgi:hypothetical protein
MKNLFYLFPCLMFVFSLSAQQFDNNINNGKDVDQKPDWKSRIITGGNFGLQFGDVTFIDLSPVIGYRFTDKFEAGIGATYQYLSFNDAYASASTNIYGGRLFGRYYFFENIFGHAEYELLSLEPIYIDGSKGKRTNVESYLVGGGYRQPLSDKLSLNLLMLWNLDNTIGYTYYQNPIIRIGMDVGF